MVCNLFGKPAKIGQGSRTDGKHHFPVDGIVVMDRDISESNCLPQGLTGLWCNGIKSTESCKDISHSCWRRLVGFTDDVTANINTELYCTGEIQNQDILYIGVLN